MRLVAAFALLILAACGRGTTYESAPVPAEAETTTTTVPYDGRLHIEFVTDGGGDVGGSVAKFKVEPAPRDVVPTLTVDEARAKARSMMGFAEGIDDGTANVYFGLYTGLEFIGNDSQGRVATQLVTKAPAWLVFGRGTMTQLSNGPCCDNTPQTFDPPRKTYGATVFRDDPSATTAIGGSITAGGWPVVY